MAFLLLSLLQMFWLRRNWQEKHNLHASIPSATDVFFEHPIVRCKVESFGTGHQPVSKVVQAPRNHFLLEVVGHDLARSAVESRSLPDFYYEIEAECNLQKCHVWQALVRFRFQLRQSVNAAIGVNLSHLAVSCQRILQLHWH